MKRVRDWHEALANARAAEKRWWGRLKRAMKRLEAAKRGVARAEKAVAALPAPPADPAVERAGALADALIDRLGGK